jgi:hypothetical protein
MLFGVTEHHCGLDVHLHQRTEYHSIERDLSLSVALVLMLFC